MSVREEDRQKNCPSRGLGIAAAAIGVGVGAALYYFFNKRSENPDGEGSTSDWSCEQPHTLCLSEEDDSYTTVSETSTTDTSMLDTSPESNNDRSLTETDTNSSESHSDMSTLNSSANDSDSPDSEMSVESNSSPSGLGLLVVQVTEGRDNLPRDMSRFLTDEDWEVAASSAGIPSDYGPVSPIRATVNRLIALRDACFNAPQEAVTREAILREQTFRERSWAVEECSICFDVMLQTQEVMSLPCTHRFHQPCILPWLQEKQNCPNCRKLA